MRSESGRPVYLGQVSWQKFEVAALRNLPFTSNFSARFTLRPDSFSVTQLQWKTSGSEIDAQANLASFAQPAWTFRYRGQTAPRGSVDDPAQARCAGRAY